MDSFQDNGNVILREDVSLIEPEIRPTSITRNLITSLKPYIPIIGVILFLAIVTYILAYYNYLWKSSG